MWTKYSYVCTNCDALIEITTSASPAFDPACTCEYQTFVTRTALEPTVQPNVMSITPSKVVKINTNPYN
jgi:DNA-directed RNA polymerase subunit RPC12/RpoP